MARTTFVSYILDAQTNPIGCYLSVPAFYMDPNEQRLVLDIITTPEDIEEAALIPYETNRCTIHLKPCSDSPDYNVFEDCLLISFSLSFDEELVSIEQTWRYRSQHIVLNGIPSPHGRQGLVARNRPQGWPGAIINRKPEVALVIPWTAEGF